MTAYAGLDVGTTSSKAVVYGEDGAELGIGRATTAWSVGPQGTETDAETLRHSAFEALSAAADAAGVPVRAVVSESARNRFTGLVTRVVRDTVMAQVEIQSGPHRIVSLMSREAADELELQPGSLAIASVKATNVVIEVPEQP